MNGSIAAKSSRRIRGVFFDFGFVIGTPIAGIERRYLYMDWDGIDAILANRDLAQHLQPGVGRAELEAFFERELYRPFVQHEQSDWIDPQSNQLLLDKLNTIFDCPINPVLVDRLLAHIDTMKYITIQPTAVKVIAELNQKCFQIAVISNMMLPGKLLQAKLREANILAYFNHITVSSDAGFIKPHPEIFRMSAARCGLRADEILFVGDTYWQDILGAKQAGMKTAWLNSRREARDIAKDHPPDFEIDSLSDLLDLPILAG